MMMKLVDKLLLSTASLQLNIEAFYWDYRDQQITFVGGAQGPDGTFAASGITLNAGQAEMYGVELDGLFKFTPVDLFSFNIQWLESEYKEFVVPRFGPSPAPPPTGCAVLGTQPVNGGFIFPIDCAGQPTINSP